MKENSRHTYILPGLIIPLIAGLGMAGWFIILAYKFGISSWLLSSWWGQLTYGIGIGLLIGLSLSLIPTYFRDLRHR